MSSLNQTPSGERLHVAIFGRRNAGKSSLINAVAGQPLAIVSEIAGTTTDPVSKAMELLPLGPIVLTDTAGLDDSGPLGALRVARSLRALERTDVAMLVVAAGETPGEVEQELAERVRVRQLPLIVVANKVDLAANSSAIVGWAQQRGCQVVATSAATGQGIDELKQAIIAAVPNLDGGETLVGDLVAPGDTVVLVVPIDKAAPKGRLILPQVMTLRDILDHDAIGVVVKENELGRCLDSLGRRPRLVVTDSQAFRKVAADTPDEVPLTGFSIVMARYRGSLEEFVRGTRALKALKPGMRVLVSEGCTHHRQAVDIGSVQIPGYLRQLAGGEVEVAFSSGMGFPDDLARYDLIVHCGACTLNRREVLYRQREARAAGIPMTNYGLVLAHVHGILDRALAPFPAAKLLWDQGTEALTARRQEL